MTFWRKVAIQEERCCCWCGQLISKKDELRWSREGRLCWNCVKINTHINRRQRREHRTHWRPDGDSWEDIRNKE